MCSELALWHPLETSVVCIESAFHRRLLPIDNWQETLVEIHELSAGKKGASAAREALKLVTPFSESPRESELKIALYRAGFPAPFQQVNIYDRRGELLGRADFMFDCGLIVEYDGRSKYDNTFDLTPLDQVLMSERAREKAFQNEGFVILRVDADNFRDQSFLAQTRTLLETMNKAGFSVPRNQWRATGRAW